MGIIARLPRKKLQYRDESIHELGSRWCEGKSRRIFRGRKNLVRKLSRSEDVVMTICASTYSTARLLMSLGHFLVSGSELWLSFFLVESKYFKPFVLDTNKSLWGTYTVNNSYLVDLEKVAFTTICIKLKNFVILSFYYRHFRRARSQPVSCIGLSPAQLCSKVRASCPFLTDCH